MYHNIKAAFISKTVSPEILKHLLIPKAHSLYRSSAMIIALNISKETKITTIVLFPVFKRI